MKKKLLIIIPIVILALSIIDITIIFRITGFKITEY